MGRVLTDMPYFYIKCYPTEILPLSRENSCSKMGNFRVKFFSKNLGK